VNVNVNESCGIDSFLVESCPAVIEALSLLSLQSSLGAY
jgi:hypothetical protein